MAHIFHSNKVQYLCTCGLLKSITEVYLCRHCLTLRCGNCVSFEVDALYCPHCLENMPSNEARLKKNRCANCFDCPSCGHTLSTRGSSMQVPNPEDPNATITKKMYYLGCTNCRWSTRDVGLEDQTHATSGWPEKTIAHEKRVQDLMEYYRSVAQCEKYEAERKKTPQKRSTYFSLPEKYSLSSSFSSLTSRKSLTPFATKIDSITEIAPSEAVENVAGLPDNIFSEHVNINLKNKSHVPKEFISDKIGRVVERLTRIPRVSTLEQRLVQPEWQPELVENMHPLHKHLIVKCSRRCRQCERNLSKPEYNPSSIKFKIQLGAYYHVPEVRISKITKVEKGELTVQLSLCNPTSHDMTATLLPFIPDVYLAANESEDSGPPSVTTLGSLMKVVDLPKEKCTVNLTAEVVLPQGQVTLLARDDTAGYDEVEASRSPKDDPQVVAWRKSNKVGVNMDVKYSQEDVSFGFLLRYDYTNTVAAAAEDRTVVLNVPVVVNLGKIQL